MSDSDARNIPQVLRIISPVTAVTALQRFGSLIADPFGALWNSVADPVTGNPVGTIQLQAAAVSQTAYALVTAAGVFGRNTQAGTGELRIVDALEVGGGGTIAGGTVAMTGLTAAATLVLADPVGGAFSTLAQRGVLNADAQPNTRVPLLSLSVQSTVNSAGTFDRVRSVSFNQALGGAGLTLGIQASAAQLYLSNAAGTSALAMLSADTAVDDIATSNSNWLRTINAPYLFDGAAFDRAGSASATNLGAQSGARAALVAEPGEWTLTNAPAANTTATATRAAGGAGVRHVLRSINATLVGVTAIAAPISVVVRDGATGVGPILWADQLFAPAAGTSDRVTLPGLNIVGSANTAMTIEFIAAPGATNFEAVAATGYSSA